MKTIKSGHVLQVHRRHISTTVVIGDILGYWIELDALLKKEEFGAQGL